MNQDHKKAKFKIIGMHCTACEVTIERKFKALPGVAKVRVNHHKGVAEITGESIPKLPALQQAIVDDGYQVVAWSEERAPRPRRKRDYAEAGAIFLLLMALYLILRRFDILPSLGISDNMGYGLVFVIGLVAALSTCMAVSGGLLLAVAAKYNEQHPNFSRWQKFKPHLYFNTGRLLSYVVLGGAVGALGSTLTLSIRATGGLTIAVSLVMLLLGLQLLNIFPALGRFQPRLPKWLGHKVHNLADTEARGGSFLLGASTFFLPCGFTQALQLYALAQGDALTGALTMGIFALGTLPGLLSVGAISSLARGTFQRYFFKVAGATVVLLGLFNINNGLNLSGLSVFAGQDNQSLDPNIELVDGVQVARMRVSGLNYYPARFTVAAGVPVDWVIDGAGAAGCAQVIVAPAIDVTEYLPRTGSKTIAFTPRQTGTIFFSCPMGMTTRGAAFTVVLNTLGLSATTPGLPQIGAVCDPKVMNCLPAQTLNMEVTREAGFYPNAFTVKKDIPVELTIDAKTPLGGCMSVLLIPDYNVSKAVSLGKNVMKFTPTKTGTSYLTCSMGSIMGQFTIVE